MNRVERLTAILLLLQERRRTAETLSRDLGVARRTILRDMQSLTAMGVPVFSQSGPYGGFEIPRDATLAPLHLTWREALLLMLAIDGLAKMTDTPFFADRTSLLAKIRAMMPDAQRLRVEEMLSKVRLEIPKRAQRTPHLERLLERCGQWTWIEYDGDERLIRIERLYADRGFWYVAAVTEGKARTFRADRIQSVAPGEPPADAPEPPPYDDPSHPLIRVRLSDRGARLAQNDPHLGPHVAGTGVIEFRCPPDELAWYSRYFGGMGPDAQVESPPELIARIVSSAKALAEQYGG